MCALVEQIDHLVGNLEGTLGVTLVLDLLHVLEELWKAA